MEFKEFYENLLNKSIQINEKINEEQAKKLYKYMKLIIEWNEKVNLTAITDEKEIILKHFIDSIVISKYINENSSIVDVGTGAGFPGIPLNIVKDKANYTLLDSLNKRINFLNEVIEKEDLKNIIAIHDRVEEFGKNKKYREKFDIATSRAVAPLNVLLEYMLPLIKVGGICICMKGPNIEDELEKSKNALKVLGGKIENIEKITLPESDIIRNIIIIKKEKSTAEKYPRKAGTPSKEPI